MMWNDGPEFIHELSDPWAPHPIVNRHICNGGGGSTAPNPPDYSQFIGATSGVANDLTAKGGTLYDWAQKAGVKLSDIADAVSTRAGGIADWASQSGKDLMSQWQSTYGPIYQAQAKNAQNFIQNLPQTMESWAGKYGADAAMAFDQNKASVLRKLQGEGLTRPSVAQGAIDLAQGNQRALGTTAAAETGRMAARQYGDTLTGQTLQAGQIFPTVSSGQTTQGLQAGNQQTGAPQSAVSTTAGAYSPYISSYGTAAPYLNNWQTAMGTAYNQQLGQFNANQQATSNSPLNTILPMALGVAGSTAAPGLGTLAAGGLSSMAPATMAAGASALGRGGGSGYTGGPFGSTGGSSIFGGLAKGGTVPSGPNLGGRMVPASLSPSGGQQVDDVHAVVDGDPKNVAAINTGEFIIPRPAVDWYGEKFLQNLVAKAEKERGEQTVAAPQAGPPPGQAINPMPPMPPSSPPIAHAKTGGRFDPEGSGYDYATARAAGLTAQPVPYDTVPHWPSREPRTGMELKGRTHPTFGLGVDEDRRMGYDVQLGTDGRYYSLERGTPRPQY